MIPSTKSRLTTQLGQLTKLDLSRVGLEERAMVRRLIDFVREAVENPATSPRQIREVWEETQRALDLRMGGDYTWEPPQAPKPDEGDPKPKGDTGNGDGQSQGQSQSQSNETKPEPRETAKLLAGMNADEIRAWGEDWGVDFGRARNPETLRAKAYAHFGWQVEDLDV